MKFVVSTKSGKAYSAASDNILFVGRKIGDTVKLDEIGLTGFEAEITGGSDKQGFPMNGSVKGHGRRKIFFAGGVGFKPKRDGERRRVSVRGNTISENISQVNLKVTKEGSVNIDELLGKKEEVTNEEEQMSAKERALKKAKENAGSDSIGDAPTKKARH